MDITLISVPFDQDEYGEGMGKAPAALKASGLVGRLEARGIHVAVEREVSLPDDDGDKIKRLGYLGTALADSVVEAHRNNQLPVVLGGDCMNAIGICAGLRRALGDKDFGIAWYDAHGDFNTPETTLSGYLPGMPLACVCGRGLDGLRNRIGLSQPVDEEHVIMLGVRDLDAPEKELLDSTPISYLAPAEVEAGKAAVAAAYHLKDLAGVYLHLDIDVIDPGEAPGVNFAVPGGLTSKTALDAGEAIRQTAPLAAICLTAVNPELDASGATLETGIRLLEEMLS